MRKQLWIGTSGAGVLDSDNINALDPADLRQNKYDEIRVEMNKRLAVIDADMQEELDAWNTGNEPDRSKVTALEQSRHDLRRVKSPAIKAQVDALGNDNTLIYEFDVEAAFAAP